MNHGQWLNMWAGYANQLNDRDMRQMANRLDAKPTLEEITYKKLSGWVVECLNCSYKIEYKDEPSDGDEVVCDNCKSKYIITDE